MQRRKFLKGVAASGLLSGASSRLLALERHETAAPAETSVVLVVAKCHLDVGFTSTQAKVIRQYFDVYYPAAISTAQKMRAEGPDRYTWTTGSWLLYEYLEQASSAQRRTMEQAIAERDIAWHALPFSWQTEMLDHSMIEGALALSQSLDRRFGVRTIAAKMTDVPGHSRGIIAPLHDAGVRLLDIGVNAASTPPDVPDIFLWKDPSGKSLAVMYHRRDYGGTIIIPGTATAVAVEVRGDNSGPHTPAEIAAIYARLRARFPDAEIKAATMSDVAAVVDRVRDRLPIVTAEIGDTWIYGCASDPYKVAQYRSVVRLRKTWIAQRKFAAGDPTDRNLLRHLLLAAEHTWGTDTKSYLDYQHYRPASLATALAQPGYRVMQTSWQEKRDNIAAGISTLPPALQQVAGAEFTRTQASAPGMSAMTTHNSSELETRHFNIAIDPATGAMIRLRSKRTGVEWASAQHPLALFTYQTLSSQQYTAFMGRYLTLKTDWAPRDFGKPGIDAFDVSAREWHPQLKQSVISSDSTEDRLLLTLSIADTTAEATGNVAWPREIIYDMRFPKNAAHIDLRVFTLRKVPNRLPEAMWLTFSPSHISTASWQIEKVNQMVSAADVVRNGGRAMHAVNSACCSTAKGERFELQTPDAPVLAFGERSPLNFSPDQPDFTKGAHICLYNNAWGTNYPQWSGGDWLYRFQLFA